MGAIIIGTGICKDSTVRSAITLASLAGKAALEKARVYPGEVDVLINVGIYREDNMVEPAMAAIIQKELGINLDYVKANPRHAAFSFDLMNGGIGALDALKVANAMLESGHARHVLIVAADIHPSTQKTPGFPFAEVGSAILLKKGENASKGIQFSHFVSKLHQHAGRTGVVKTKLMGTTGRSRIDIVESKDYLEALTQFTLETTRTFINQHKLKSEELFLIPSQISKAHIRTLQNSLGIKETLDLSHDFGGDTHSATYGAGLHQLMNKGIKVGQKILLAGGSSGLAAGCVLYVA